MPPAGGDLQLVQQMLGLRDASFPDEFKDIVFVCVDCEAFEFKQDKITEVGVAVLDLKGFEGGSTTEAQDFLAKIQTAHYRISENARFVNKRHVKGCPEAFNFGKSVFIHLQQAKNVLGRIFKDPSLLSTAHHRNSKDNSPTETRKIVLVGHDISNDADYLRRLDFNLSALTNIIAKADTQRLSAPRKHPTGLAKLLQVLEIEAKNLHNAGNDAAYTMQALVELAVREARVEGSVTEVLRQQREAKAAAALVGGGDGKDGEKGPNRRERKKLKRLEVLEERRQCGQAGEGEGVKEESALDGAEGVEPTDEKLESAVK